MANMYARCRYIIMNRFKLFGMHVVGDDYLEDELYVIWR